MDNKKLKFSQTPGGLYARKSKEENNENTNNDNNKQKQNYLTVQDNYKFLSNRQIKQAQEVKRLQNALGLPSSTDLKTINTMNMIQNNQITHEDIYLAEQTLNQLVL